MKKCTLYLLSFLFLLPLLMFAQQKSLWDQIPEDIKQSKPFKRFEWYYKQRAFPFDTIPHYQFIKTQEKEKERIKNSFNKISDLPVWSSVGPNGSQSRIGHWGITSGRVRAIAVHPNDPLTVYIGAACGGIWKTTDGGESWMNIGEDLESLSFGAIDIDSNNPEVIYAGSGEVDFIPSIFHFTGRGLFKSINGGQSWIQIPDGFGLNTHFGDLSVNPHNSNIVIAALASGYAYGGGNLTNEGIWKSTDAGSTWTKTLDLQDAYDILFHPTDPNLVYAAIGGMTNNSGFYISTDQGNSWVQSDSGLQAANTIARMQIDISQSNPNVIYSVTYQTGSGYLNGTTRAYKSTNGGINWSQISAGVNLGGRYPNGSWVDQGFYDLCIAVNPVNPDNVFIGNVELHETTNGADFVPRRIQGGVNVLHSVAHGDYHKLIFSRSNPSYFYIGCDGGVFKSTDGVATVNSVNEGLRTLQFYRIASSPFNPEIIMGGTQDNGTLMTFDYGQNWSETPIGGDGMECIFDYSDPQIVYSSIYNCKIYKSSNGGTSWINMQFPSAGAWITPYFLHPTNPSIIYVATKGIWKYDGTLWTALTQNIAPVSISTMAQSSVNPYNMIFATGGGDWPAPDTVFIVKISTDGGYIWEDVTANIHGESRWISRVETDPLDSNTMYVLRTGFSENNKLYKTTDLGQTWTNISGNLEDIPYSDVFIYPTEPDYIFVASDIGVYMTTNGGAEWIYASEEIPLVPCFDFDFVLIDSVGHLRVGTHGQSIWEAQILPPAPNISINPTILEFGGVLVNNDSTMTFSITNTGNAELIVTNISSNEPAFTVNNDSIAVPPGDEKDVDVTFTPTSLGSYNGIIEITHNAIGSPDSVTATGNGVTGISDELMNTIPDDFVIYQNYPNPFNPKTSIIFGLPEASEVKLTLFNALGEEIANLFEAYKNAGFYQVEFDASRLTSGIYFYQIQAGDFIETKKMVLLR